MIEDDIKLNREKLKREQEEIVARRKGIVLPKISKEKQPKRKVRLEPRGDIYIPNPFPRIRFGGRGNFFTIVLVAVGMFFMIKALYPTLSFISSGAVDPSAHLDDTFNLTYIIISVGCMIWSIARVSLQGYR